MKPSMFPLEKFILVAAAGHVSRKGLGTLFGGVARIFSGKGDFHGQKVPRGFTGGTGVEASRTPEKISKFLPKNK